jgi:DNA-binding winged helix-turn-helix (wHTH) protein
VYSALALNARLNQEALGDSQGEIEFVLVDRVEQIPSVLPYCRRIVATGRIPIVVMTEGYIKSKRLVIAGDMCLDTETAIFSVGNHRISLTRKELAAMHALMEMPGRLLRRAELSRRIWGDSPREAVNLSVLISALRRKIEADPSRPSLIRTIRYTGYVLDIPGQPSL